MSARQFWDQRFAGETFKYGLEPNAFLRAEATRLAPGSRVLVPGDGEGRNGVWLAQQGHRVCSVDASPVGLDKALRLARQRGVDIDVELGDLEVWAPVPGAWDALVLIYVHLPLAWRTPVHRRLAQGLRPGGRVIVEAFHPAQLGRDSGGPRDLDMLCTLEDLRADFGMFCEELSGWQGEVMLDEGPGHQGAAQVTRWSARRRG